MYSTSVLGRRRLEGLAPESISCSWDVRLRGPQQPGGGRLTASRRTPSALGPPPAFSPGSPPHWGKRPRHPDGARPQAGAGGKPVLFGRGAGARPAPHRRAVQSSGGGGGRAGRPRPAPPPPPPPWGAALPGPPPPPGERRAAPRFPSPCPARRGGRCCPARSGGCSPGCAPPSSPRRGNPPSRWGSRSRTPTWLTERRAGRRGRGPAHCRRGGGRRVLPRGWPPAAGFRGRGAAAVPVLPGPRRRFGGVSVSVRPSPPGALGFAFSARPAGRGEVTPARRDCCPGSRYPPQTNTLPPKPQTEPKPLQNKTKIHILRTNRHLFFQLLFLFSSPSSPSLSSSRLAPAGFAVRRDGFHGSLFRSMLCRGACSQRRKR